MTNGGTANQYMSASARGSPARAARCLAPSSSPRCRTGRRRRRSARRRTVVEAREALRARPRAPRPAARRPPPSANPLAIWVEYWELKDRLRRGAAGRGPRSPRAGPAATSRTAAQRLAARARPAPRLGQLRRRVSALPDERRPRGHVLRAARRAARRPASASDAGARRLAGADARPTTAAPCSPPPVRCPPARRRRRLAQGAPRGRGEPAARRAPGRRAARPARRRRASASLDNPARYLARERPALRAGRGRARDPGLDAHAATDIDVGRRPACRPLGRPCRRIWRPGPGPVARQTARTAARGSRLFPARRAATAGAAASRAARRHARLEGPRRRARDGESRAGKTPCRRSTRCRRPSSSSKKDAAGITGRPGAGHGVAAAVDDHVRPRRRARRSRWSASARSIRSCSTPSSACVRSIQAVRGGPYARLPGQRAVLPGRAAGRAALDLHRAAARPRLRLVRDRGRRDDRRAARPRRHHHGGAAAVAHRDRHLRHDRDRRRRLHLRPVVVAIGNRLLRWSPKHHG